MVDKSKSAPSGRILSRDLGAVLAGTSLIFVNTTLLVPVLPAIASRSGGSGSAGLATAFFYFPAVATQLQMPAAMRRYDGRLLLVAAFVLLGAPCIAYAAAKDSLAVLLSATAVRGVGFGIATVACGTLVAQLAPEGQRGKVIGWAGLAAGIPPVFAPAAGVYLFHHAGIGTVSAVAAAAGLAGAAAALLLSSRVPVPRPRPVGLLRAFVRSELAWPFSWFLLVSLGRGAVLSFVTLWLLRGGLASSAAYLLLFGTAAYLARWKGGALVDRFGARALLLPGSAASLSGLVLLATGDGPGVVIAAAALLFGTGYGLLATSSQLDMLERGGVDGFAVSTTAWNIAIDFGVGLGGAVIGAFAAIAGLGAAFWLLPAVIGVAIVLMVFEPRPDKPSPGTVTVTEVPREGP